jgi:hypothetical protein
VFRSRPVRDAGNGDGEAGDEGGREWEVATGALDNVVEYVRVGRHDNIEDTKDGGLSIWMTEQHGWPLPVSPSSEVERREAKPSGRSRDIPAAQPAHAQSQPPPPIADLNFLHAHCACNAVKFHIMRPSASSILPHSQFPDLMIPYHTKDPLIPNAGDEKWWLRADGVKYLAGTCACRSCRLTSGFEIQTWAFVPRANIFFHVPRSANLFSGPDLNNELEEIIIPLDFNEFRELEKAGKTVLRSYESSPGVLREFCGTCGATIFWHDKWRPEVVDVSVGLLEAQEGARAEEWLEWWVERVSFEEDAAGRGDLIPALRRGLWAWDEARKATERGRNGMADQIPF